MTADTNVSVSVRCVCLLAGVVCLLALPAPAMAVVVYSTDFESSEGYSTGDLAGQDGWVDGSACASAVVQTADVSSGSQAVEVAVESDNWTGSRHKVITHSLTDPTAANPDVTIIQDVKLVTDEADFAIAIYDGATMTNEIVLDFDGNILVNSTDKGDWTSGWRELEMKLDFDNEKIEVKYDGVWITGATPLDFAASGGLTEIAILSDEFYLSGSSIFYDDLSIVAVPEPTTAVLLAASMCVVLVARRRPRRPA